MPVYPDTTPSWLHPENASVLDTALMKLIRLLANANPVPETLPFGGRRPSWLPNPNPLSMMTDPQSQVLALAGADITGGPIKAYHGSPHDFEQFDASKIGTGEGAQAYGHGLYFAENPAVAQDYKKALGGASAEITVPGKETFQTAGHHNPDVRAAGYLLAKHGGDFKAAALDGLRQGYRGAYPGVIDKLAQWEQQGASVAVKDAGRTYEVAIHADPAMLLDWDKPLSQQSPQVQAAVTKARGVKDVRPVKLNDGSYSVTAVQPDGSGRIVWDVRTPTPEQAMDSYRRYVSESPGMEVYHDMARGITGKTSESMMASDALKQAGIPGIQYLDQGSRAVGEGTRNYVMFPGTEKLIEILRKLALLAPIPAAAAMPHSQEAR